MIDDFHTRIEKLIKVLEISKTNFAEKINMTPQALHNIISGRKSKPGFDTIVQIINSFDLNPIWLILGEGEMFRGASVVQKETPVQVPPAQNECKEEKETIRKLVDQIREMQQTINALMQGKTD